MDSLKESVYDVIQREVWDYVVSKLGEPENDEAIITHYSTVHSDLIKEVVRKINSELKSK